MQPPIVSVVIPYYSHGRHLHHAVSSALRACSRPMEIIIVNDGSPEPKAPIYLRAARNLSPVVRVIEQTNHGLSAARNAGVIAAKGEFVQFLDSDDLLVPGKIDLQLDQLTIQPRLSASVTNYLLSDEDALHYRQDGDPISRFDLTLGDFLFSWERGFSIPIHCGLFRRNAVIDTPFDTTIDGKEDWVFWCRFAAAGRRLGYLSVFGAIYRQHDASMSKSFARMADNWLAAAELIKPLARDDAPAFMESAHAWRRDFYQPRIDQQAKDQSAARDEAPPPPQDTDWILAAARRRTNPEPFPLVSVIVPVFNHLRHLPACLGSIVAQNADGGVEIVLVDDASSDPAVAPLLEAFAAAMPGVKLIRNRENQGICRTQNQAIEAASGEFIAFLDCDDALPEGALARVAAALGPGVDYLFTDRQDINEAGKPTGVARYGGYSWIKPSGDISADLLDGMVASHLKVIRRSAYLEAGGADAELVGVQDWEMALRLSDRDRFVYLPEPLYLHRRHDASVTTSDSVHQFWLSNVVRRRYAGPQLGRTLPDDDAVSRATAACQMAARGLKPPDDIFVVRAMEHFTDTRKLKAAWRAGKVCIYAPRVEASPSELCIAREFNSYFDGVMASDEATACMFVGYMWRPDALHLAGEFRT